jgi:hypothetical protein
VGRHLRFVHAKLLDDNLFYAFFYAGHSHSSAPTVPGLFYSAFTPGALLARAKIVVFHRFGQPAHSMHGLPQGQLRTSRLLFGALIGCPIVPNEVFCLGPYRFHDHLGLAGRRQPDRLFT